MGSVRKAAVAGTWYPAHAKAIRGEVESYLGLVPESPLSGHLFGLISPHAGLRYSGAVAAHGYALLRGTRDLTVVLVGPSHRVPFDGLALIARGAFETPLGRTPIDEDLADRLLAAHPFVINLPEPHRAEHSLEMQLPFLQHLVPGLRIVPILMGYQGREEAEALAEALVTAIGPRQDVLLVASSDLSHYHAAHKAHELDAAVLDDVSHFDAETLMGRLRRLPGHACGGGAMVAVMKAAATLGAHRTAILRYSDSSEVGERDATRVVGYLSAALLK
jgi:hypothetical protein